jgi:NADPH:quinone reductase-like Zn-dependent oxidoreductase
LAGGLSVRILWKLFQMKSAVLYKAGGQPVFSEWSDPVPGPDDLMMFVRAASIKNIDRMLVANTHYDRYPAFPVIVGTDGVGILENGQRVYSGSKKGMMSEKVIVNKNWYVPLPDELDDVQAAALPNPAVSAWLSLEKGQLRKDDKVLVLGATGTTGKLAVQLAKHLGAGKIVAMGRNPTILNSLPALGADKIISLNQSPEHIRRELQKEIQEQPFRIVLDYLWGQPAELVLDGLTGNDLEAESFSTRWIQIGEMAASSIRLQAAALRSSGIELSGQGGGSIPIEVLAKIPTFYLPEIFRLAVAGKLKVETETVTLKDIEKAWTMKNQEGKRMVVLI